MRIQWEPYLWAEPHPVESQVLDRLEQQWKVKLPELYRELVSRYEGMGPEPCAFDVGTGNDAFSVLLHVPEGLFPFALTPGGEHLCFDYRDSPEHPRVVLVTAEMSIHPIADKFTSFMNGLYSG